MLVALIFFVLIMFLLFSTFELCMFLARVFRFAFRFACWDAATQLAYRFASRFACWGAAPQLAFGFSSHLLGRVQPHSLLLDLLLDLLSGLLLVCSLWFGLPLQ